ncbi:MAG: UDP-3-O-3-hydroxymyristoyl glucosamine N-acyltransferase [Hyphomonadaceae bacterium]|nr:MAG: UDP-3-O-3-hydroxymyristoyl glucosamine N-acyltransferase [Hyphomonadaceae bacterium]
MIDKHFYEVLSPLSLQTIAKLSGCLPIDNEYEAQEITSVASLDSAQTGQLAFCEKAKDKPIKTAASAVFMTQKDAHLLPSTACALVVAAPRAAFANIAILLVKPISTMRNAKKQDHENDVEIGEGAIIGEGAQIGAGSKIGPNALIGAGVKIGRNCEIGANVAICCAYIGDGVTIGANSVIGKSGFGVAFGKAGPIDVPQYGRVIIQDNVTIGALCTIDRGAFGDTIIGLGCKIDNHCHIGHNAKLGQGVVIAAFGGISGSVEIGDFAVLGGRVGVIDHVKIGAKAMIGAGGLALSDVPAGQVYSGYPAKPRVQWMRELVSLSKLNLKKQK